MRERISRQGGRVGRRGRARLVRPGLEALGLLPWACDLLGCGWPWGEAWAWGEALPSGLCCCLGCAPCAWACMCACVYGRVSLPVCCLGYARRLWPQPHPRRTTPRPEALPPAADPLPACCPARAPGLQPGRLPILQARPPATWPQPRRRGFMRPVWSLVGLSYMPPYNPPKHSILHRKSPRKFVQKNFPTSPL